MAAFVSTTDDSSYLPECWSNDERMNYLFLEFRNKNLNPTAWESKMNFWVDCIQDFCSIKQTPLFELSDLDKAFRRKNKSPSCLTPVIMEMRRQKKLVTYSEYANLARNQGWIQWGYNVAIKKPISAGWGAMKWYLSQTEDPSKERLVNLAALQSVADEMHQKLLSLERSMFRLQEVTEIFLKSKISLECTDLILLYLERNSKIEKITNSDGKFLKLIAAEDLSKEVSSEEEIKMLKLKAIQKEVTEEIVHLEQLIDRHKAEAKMQLKQGSRSLAKNALQRMKRCESMLSKKSIALDNIQSLMTRIEDAGTDQMVVEAYKAGVSAYKAKLGSGLNLEDVDEVMDSVHEVIGLHEEVSNTITSLADDFQDPSKEELEKELEQIIADSKETEDMVPDKDDSLDLPNVPDDDLQARIDKLRFSSPSEFKSKEKKKLAKAI